MRRFLYPPWPLTCLLALLSAIALCAVFYHGWEDHPLATGSYILSFYTLTVLLLRLPALVRRGKRLLHSRPLSHRYLTDAAFKTQVSLWLSLGINLLFAGTNLVSGLIERSPWFYTLAGYYGILCVLRLTLIHYVNYQDRKTSLRISRRCAAVLLLVNLFLAGTVLMILNQGRGYNYPGFLIYAAALHAFYSTTSAARSLVLTRRGDHIIMLTTSVVKLTSALVSMLALETAMLAQFGTYMPETTHRIFIASTGGGISAIIIALAGYLIFRTTRDLQDV